MPRNSDLTRRPRRNSGGAQRAIVASKWLGEMPQ
jgi:hypothetical protein